MTNFLRASALLIALTLGACGARATTADTTTARAEPEAELSWTRALLRKLDPPLRARVRDGDDGRLAVKVFFRSRVRDSTLATLMLTQVGNHYVGNVGADTLQQIAARADVDRIETLQDVGY